MAPVPPPFPPNVTPPQVPAGWKADWSPEHKTWYYLSLATGASQWELPAQQQIQAPYGAPVQQYPPQPTYTQESSQSPGPDGERGLGKIAAGGLLGVAGGLLAGAIWKHEREELEEHKIEKPHFSFWNNNDSQSGPASWFSNLGSSKPDYVKPVAAAAGGGMFGAMANHLPHMPGGAPTPHHTPTPSYHAPQPVQSYHTPPPAQAYRPAPPPAQSYQAPAPAYQAQPGRTAGPPYPAPPVILAGPSYHNTFPNTSNSPPLHIHCAAYCDQDVTQIVRRMVDPQTQSFEVSTQDLKQVFGDPWPTNTKQFSVLYSYGNRPWELYASKDDQGQFSIIPHQPLDNYRMKFCQDARGRVVAFVWGTYNGLDEGEGPLVKLQKLETTGEIGANNKDIGFDGWCGTSKTAVVYYRAPNGEVKFAAAREEGTVRLPWNPLARWN